MPTRYGTPASDVYYVTSSDDSIIEAANGGTDTIFTSVSYRITAGSHVERLIATDPAGTAPLALTGNEWNQEIVGNAGANLINGDRGYDVLTGGGGADRFVASGNIFTITDFDPADDRILFNNLFSAIPNGPLAASAFVVGPAPTDPNHRIIYDIDTGNLFYDPDGNGTGSAAYIGKVAAGLTGLSAANFERNPAPTAVSETASVDLRTGSRTASGNVLANDSDAQGEPLALLDFNKSPGPDYGTIVGQADGSFTFTVADTEATRALRSGQTGTVIYTTRVTDSIGNISASALTVTVVGVNDAPIAVDDFVTATEETAAAGIRGNVRTNDTDPDLAYQEILTVYEVNGVAMPSSTSTDRLVVQGQYGTLSIDEYGTYTYTLTNTAALSDGQVGQEVFEYGLADQNGGTDKGNLTFQVYGSTSPSTPVGGEVTVNTIWAGDQVAPAVAALSNGGFVVVWQSAENGGDIKAQMFGADGQKTGAEFLVSASPAGVQLSPAVTALDTGGFAVAWHSDYDLKSQSFDLAGNKVGQEFTLDLPAPDPATSGELTLTDQIQVADLVGAGYVVAFLTKGQDFSAATRAWAQIVEDAGTGRGGQIDVGGGSFGSSVDVAGLSSGGFAVGYDYSQSVDRGWYYTNVGIYGADGAVLRPPFNTYLGRDMTMTRRPEGGFIVAAQEDGIYPDNPNIIGAVAFDNSGNGLYGGQTVSGFAPSVAALAGQGHIVTFSRNGDIGAQLFDAAGAPVRGYFTINSILAGDQLASDVTFLTDGRAVVVWQDAGGSDGNGSGIKAQLMELSFAAPTGTAGADRHLGTEGADEYRGREGDDDISGRGGNDLLFGDEGADVIRGEAGNDYLEGGTGNDRLFGSIGADFLTGGADNDFLEGQEDNDELHGGDGDDHVDGGLANDRVYGGAGNDLVIGGFGADQLYGEAGADQLFAGDHDDYADGGEGADLIFGGLGFDLLIGGLDDDQIFGDQDNDRLFGGAGADYLSGGHGFDTINGGIGADFAVGGEGADTIVGEDGDDELHGQNGNDYLSGGAGFDRLYGGAGADVLVAGADDDIVLGGEDADELHGQDGNDHVDGGSGNDALFGGTGGDTLIGGLGNDRMEGAEENDVLLGEDGDDLLDGGSGADALSGGEGADRLAGGIDGDQLFGDNGDDQLYGGSGDDAALGGAGADYLDGGDGADIVNGGLGADVAVGGGGNDTMVGEDGDDELQGQAGDDYLSGGFGFDRLYGGLGADFLVAGADNDILLGEDDADELHGQDGDDFLDGGSGVDLLLGGEGNDILIGGAAADRLFGQGGADIFSITDINGAADGDQLLDFSSAQGDKIDLTRIDANANAAGMQSFTFLGTGAFTGQAGQLRYESSNGQSRVFGDLNGDGAADFSFQVNAPTLAASDFFGIAG